MIGKSISNILIGDKSRYRTVPPEGYQEFLNSFSEQLDFGIIVNPVKVTNIKTHGKFLYWSLSNNWHILCQFGMSGQFSPKEGKHVCLQIQLNDLDQNHNISNIYFNDPRHFGTIKFVKGNEELQKKLNSLGWDPFQDDSESYLPFIKSKLQFNKKPIAQVLMDQSIFAGVGNYIRAEALYLSKLSPWTICSTMTDEQIKKLCVDILAVMTESYDHQGATILTYKTVYGEEGRYSGKFQVYGKKQDPLGNVIIKEPTPDKRIIHWCPNIQK